MKKILISIFLIGIGTFKPISDLLEFNILSGIAAATNISPSMKVFTAHDGYETFSSSYEIQLFWDNNIIDTHEVSHALYKKIKGPYNRRNVYGAMISYGPLLLSNPMTKDMFNQIAQNIFCNSNHFLNELEINNRNQELLKVNILTKQQSHRQSNNFPNILEITCNG